MRNLNHGRDMMRTQKGFYSEASCLATSMGYTYRRFPAGNPVLADRLMSVKRTCGGNAKIRCLIVREYRSWETKHRKVGISRFSTIASVPGIRRE